MPSGLFEMIQSVDSLHLAQEINKRAEQAAKTIPILLEVNAAGEASKSGYSPERLLAEFGQINALPRLEIHGLMSVPPWTPNPEKTARSSANSESSRTSASNAWGRLCRA